MKDCPCYSVCVGGGAVHAHVCVCTRVHVCACVCVRVGREDGSVSHLLLLGVNEH